MILIAVLSIIFASVVCVYGLGDDGSKMQYCDNVDRIADSAWEMCGHHRKGFTWNDVEMCEVIKILINFNGIKFAFSGKNSEVLFRFKSRRKGT